ncbi:MAG: hypothetical protein EOR81_26000 [Mesorhizobium sp.]|nr:MAG: hypothetical protein EOR81_26000 [Mesorhizobium sp.]
MTADIFRGTAVPVCPFRQEINMEKRPMNSWQINTLEACCLLAVPLSMILTVLVAGFILG